MIHPQQDNNLKYIIFSQGEDAVSLIGKIIIEQRSFIIVEGRRGQLITLQRDKIVSIKDAFEKKEIIAT